MRIGKYEFKSEEQAEDKILDLGFDVDQFDVRYPTHKHSVVKLGHIILEQGEYKFNDDGTFEEIKKPVLSEKYHVDVMWYELEEHPYGWKTYSCDLDTEGMHSFSGVSYLENKIIK